MTMLRAIGSLTLLLLSARSLKAQGAKSPQVSADTLSIHSASDSAESRVVLTASGPAVEVVVAGRSIQFNDRLEITTPFQIVTPKGRFSLKADAMTRMGVKASGLRWVSKRDGRRFSSTIYTPFAIARTDSTADLSASSAKGTVYPDP